MHNFKHIALKLFVMCSSSLLSVGQGTECIGVDPSACRARAVNILQTSLSGRFPLMRIRADGDVIVLTDPRIFIRQEDRASFLRQSAPKIENQMCRYGFKKIRFESATKTTPAHEYALSCAKSNHPTQTHAEALTTKRSASPEPIAELAHPAVVNGAEQSPASDSGHPDSQSEAGVIAGKIFLITRDGDLKPARLAMVFLLDAHAGGEGGKDSATLFYFNKKIENMKTSYRQLTDPDDGISCPASLLVFGNSLTSTLEWNEEGEKNQIKTGQTDEDGAFRFLGVLPGEYLILAQGQAGANRAYWEEEATAESGKEVSIKLASPKSACLEF